MPCVQVGMLNGQALDVLNVSRFRRPQGVPEVPIALTVEPEFRSGAEKPRQTQRRVGRDASLPLDDLVNPWVGDFESCGSLRLRYAQWFEEVLEQHLARMGWRPMFGQSCHIRFLSGDNRRFQLLPGRGQSPEADPVSIVDPDAVLPVPPAFQLLQSVSWRNAQINQLMGLVELIKFSARYRPEILRARLASSF